MQAPEIYLTITEAISAPTAVTLLLTRATLHPFAFPAPPDIRIQSLLLERRIRRPFGIIESLFHTTLETEENGTKIPSHNYARLPISSWLRST